MWGGCWMDSSPCDELCQGNRRASWEPAQVEKTERIVSVQRHCRGASHFITLLQYISWLRLLISPGRELCVWLCAHCSVHRMTLVLIRHLKLLFNFCSVTLVSFPLEYHCCDFKAILGHAEVWNVQITSSKISWTHCSTSTPKNVRLSRRVGRNLEIRYNNDSWTIHNLYREHFPPLGS